VLHHDLLIVLTRFSLSQLIGSCLHLLSTFLRQPGESLDDYLATAKGENVKLNRTQPYIICCGNSYYVACDDKAILVSPAKFASAITHLFGVYFIFNTVYPKQLVNLFQFLEVYLFDMQRRLPARATNILTALQ
jgi:hypothetical protein